MVRDDRQSVFPAKGPQVPHFAWLSTEVDLTEADITSSEVIGYATAMGTPVSGEDQ